MVDTDYLTSAAPHIGIVLGWAAIEAGHRDRVEQRRQQR